MGNAENSDNIARGVALIAPRDRLAQLGVVGASVPGTFSSGYLRPMELKHAAGAKSAVGINPGAKRRRVLERGRLNLNEPFNAKDIGR